jgi:hypothetical protein
VNDVQGFSLFLGRSQERRGTTYRLEESCGEVLVNGKVTLLGTEAALEGGLLSSVNKVHISIADQGTLTVAALKAAATGRPRASLNMMRMKKGGGER